MVSDLTAIQRGTRIIISFPLTRPPGSGKLGRISIYRLIEAADAPLGLAQEEFSARSTIISEIPGEAIPAARTSITYQDMITPSPNSSLSRYRYAVRLVSANGVVADFSNYAITTPVIDVAKPPAGLQTEVRQSEISITWVAPSENEPGTSPANVAGYNLYRRTDGDPKRLNAQPLVEPSYLDRSFQFGMKYEYFVRTLSTATAGGTLSEAIESNDSRVVGVIPKDTFAPGPPDSIKIASINGIVSMFWPSNPEPDLAGYLIYRSENENASAAQWLKLTPRLHTPTTFRDDKVVVGKKYYYRVTAVDTSGNESARSISVAEEVNP